MGYTTLQIGMPSHSGSMHPQKSLFWIVWGDATILCIDSQFEPKCWTLKRPWGLIRASPFTETCICVMYFHFQLKCTLSVSRVTLYKINSCFKCTFHISRMPYCLEGFGFKYTIWAPLDANLYRMSQLSIFLFFSRTSDNVLDGVPKLINVRMVNIF